MADSTAHEDLITEFCFLTGASPLEAEQYLDANHWDLSSAAAEFFTAQEEGAQEGHDEPEVPENYTGPRTLDGRPAPSAIPTVASSSRPARQQARGGFATLESMNQAGGAHAGHGHAHDDDDDDEDYEDDEQPRDLFAGGEKSGLAVQDPSRRNDPKSVVNDIIKKAQAQSKKVADESPSTQAPTRFRGTGMTLGGDDTPSQAIPDPTTPSTRPSRGDVETRVLHLWLDGFSIEDGPLHRFDDPQNAATLQLIRSGRAPIHLMNVQPNQSVDVSLSKHNEPYKPQPKVYKPFSGGGQRLGSPAPGGISSSNTAAAPPAAATPPPAYSAPEVQIDSSQPTLTLRIQLANGSRLPARFNTTQTIGDVYDFISQASSDSRSRPWVLATTFPNKDHTNKDAVLGDVPEFKKGGTAVQKWA